MLGALFLLARARLREVPRRIWLDGLIVGLGLAALSASVVFRSVAADTDAMAIATTLAYPVGDLLLLIATATLFSTARARADRTFQVIVAATAVLLVTDSIWLLQLAHGAYVHTSALAIVALASTVEPGAPPAATSPARGSHGRR